MLCRNIGEEGRSFYMNLLQGVQATQGWVSPGTRGRPSGSREPHVGDH